MSSSSFSQNQCHHHSKYENDHGDRGLDHQNNNCDQHKYYVSHYKIILSSQFITVKL